ncbi:DNA alkylation repair protein [Pengzhenrongella sicca]|uniref:DNA alkylation repair protein n=1 Tax=Pengzhenrongella sicca TaxID=2819238 RepID=A0A8A4ZAS0_9MICO|nr:DNA alkylation repair protein [Pengzhenrongella sicca]QTE27983.1 DNA alkylation repair protein [Pengzhenrongella sicca]
MEIGALGPTALDAVRAELAAAAEPARVAALGRYLQAGPGGYGEGDRFLGVRVPAQRAVARRHHGALTLDDVAALLRSPWHEERLTAVFVLVRRFERGDDRERAAAVQVLLAHTDRLNNWDLVDSSAPYVLGPWLLERDDAVPERDDAVLDRLAASDLLWDRRIAIMATFAYIRAGRFDRTLELAERLLHDEHDLIHKAVGWMLREVGNRDRPAAEAFLSAHHAEMPRTMLRYAIERFPAPLRATYLRGSEGRPLGR